jgi:hypothetical protein
MTSEQVSSIKMNRKAAAMLLTILADTLAAIPMIWTTLLTGISIP